LALTPEAKVKQFIRKYMKEHFPDAWFYAPPGGAFGKAGVPDYMYFWHGVFIMIEAKAGRNKATKLQLRNLKQVQAQSGVAAIVTDRDIAKMDSIRKAIMEKAIDCSV